MGYYTSYGFTLVGDPEKCEKFEKDLSDAGRDSEGEKDFEIEQLIDSGSVYAKLYDIENIISRVAKMNPDVLAILTGDGEASDDLWEARWKGDQYEVQSYVIPPFTNPALQTEDEKTN